MKIIKKSFVVLIVLILNLIFLTDKVNAATYSATVPDSNVLFEGIGNYSIATAVSNFAKCGDTFSIRCSATWIKSYPNSVSDIQYDWSEVQSRLAEDGITNLSNITGSKIVFDGTVKRRT